MHVKVKAGRQELCREQRHFPRFNFPNAVPVKKGEI
jgi:hypothetical protein